MQTTLNTSVFRPAQAALLLAASIFGLSPLAMAEAAPSCAKAAAAAHWKPVTSIDFSSKHNVLIQNEDGTTTPMDVPYFKSEQVVPGVWRILSDGDYSYLIEGSNQALAIDSTYGAGNIRAYMQTLTKKPVRYVANTHHHFDHTANDAYFDCAYMSAETAKLATVPFNSFSGMSFPNDYPKVIVKDGDTIDLGDRQIEVFTIPNHTTGDTAYLDKKSRILFSGDAIFKGSNTIATWSTVANFERNMARLEAHRKDFDQIATGGFGVIEGSYVDKFLANTQYILAGHEGAPMTGRGGPGGGGPGGPGGGPGGPGGGGPGGGAGGPGGGGPGGPPAAKLGPNGEVVYRRKNPRAGDSAESSAKAPAQQAAATPPPSPQDMRRMTYDDVNITYNINHVQ